MSSRFLKWPYPEDQHLGRLLFADPVAQDFDPKFQAFKWIERYANWLEVGVDELIYVGLTRFSPKIWPEYLKTIRDTEIDPEYWKQLVILTGQPRPYYVSTKENFLIPL